MLGTLGTEPRSSVGAASALIHRASFQPQPEHSVQPTSATSSKDSHSTWQRCFQLSCGLINFFFVIYFYLKEFVSLSQKLDSHTANSKVHSYTDGGEFSGYSQCPKGKKEGKGTQNTSKRRWERHHMPFLSLLIISCRRLLGGSNTIWLQETLYTNSSTLIVPWLLAAISTLDSPSDSARQHTALTNSLVSSSFRSLSNTLLTVSNLKVSKVLESPL